MSNGAGVIQVSETKCTLDENKHKNTTEPLLKTIKRQQKIQKLYLFLDVVVQV
jgi:hypothetical protein